jgi:molybdopterin-guanine dinucleotide biosynthesis protein A
VGIRHPSTPHSPEAATAYLTFPRLFKEGDHPVPVHSALILAGGESRRFGGPKALVKIAGRPLIAHVAETMASLAGETIVSVGGAGGEAGIQPVLPDARFAFDVRHDRGPIEGFNEGFHMARGNLVLVAPCDAPLLRAALYRLLLEVLGDHEAAVPALDVLDPVRAVYRRDPVMAVLEASSSVRSPSALVDRLDCVHVSPVQLRGVDPDLSSFVDVNTQIDLDDVLQRMGPPK